MPTWTGAHGLVIHSPTLPTRPGCRVHTCVATATADDLLVPSADPTPPPLDPTRTRIDDDDHQNTPYYSRRSSTPSRNSPGGRGRGGRGRGGGRTWGGRGDGTRGRDNRGRDNSARRNNNYTPPSSRAPLPVSDDLSASLIPQAEDTIRRFVDAVESADLHHNMELAELRASTHGIRRAPQQMRCSQLIHLAYLASHVLSANTRSNTIENQIPHDLCLELQTAVLHMVVLGPAGSYPPTFPQLRKLLNAMKGSRRRVQGTEGELLEWLVVQLLPQVDDLRTLGKTLDVWTSVGRISPEGHEQVAQQLMYMIMALRSGVGGRDVGTDRVGGAVDFQGAQGPPPPELSSEDAYVLCEAVAQSFSVWARVRYLPQALDAGLLVDMLGVALPCASTWQVAMILRNLPFIGIKLTAAQHAQWAVVVNNLVNHASKSDLHKILGAYGAMRMVPRELDLDALTAALFDHIESRNPVFLPGMVDALGSLNLPTLPLTFDQARFGEAVNAGIDSLRAHEVGMLLRGLLRVHCLPFTLDYDRLAVHVNTCIAQGMATKDLVSTLLFFQQLEHPPDALCMETVGVAVSNAAPSMSGSDLMRALRCLGTLRVAVKQGGQHGIDTEQLGRVLTQRMEMMEARELVQLAPVVGRLRLGPMHTFDAGRYQQLIAQCVDDVDPAYVGAVMLGLGNMGVDVLDNTVLQQRMLMGVDHLRYKELSMLLSSLVKTNTTLTEQQLLSLGSAFTAQLKYFSARQMSGSLWSFSRLGGLPSNFSLRDAEGIMMPALATLRSNEICSFLCGLAAMYGLSTTHHKARALQATNSDTVNGTSDTPTLQANGSVPSGTDSGGTVVNPVVNLGGQGTIEGAFEGAAAAMQHVRVLHDDEEEEHVHDDDEEHVEDDDEEHVEDGGVEEGMVGKQDGGSVATTTAEGAGQQEQEQEKPRPSRPSIDFVQEAVSVLTGRNDLPKYLSTILWVCTELRVLPTCTSMQSIKETAAVTVQSQPQCVATLLLNLAKLRISLPMTSFDTCLETAIDHATSVHDLSLVGYATAMMLADNPAALPHVRPTLERLLAKIEGTTDEEVNLDDARQLLSLHYMCCMIEDKQGEQGSTREQHHDEEIQHHEEQHDDKNTTITTTLLAAKPKAPPSTGILSPHLLQRCQALVATKPPVPLNEVQANLAAIAAQVPEVEHVITNWAPLDGIVRMAIVCKMNDGKSYGLHTHWPHSYFRNAREVDGPANVRRELLQWQGVHVVRLNRSKYMSIASDEGRVDKVRKLLRYAAAAEGGDV